MDTSRAAPMPRRQRHRQHLDVLLRQVGEGDLPGDQRVEARVREDRSVRIELPATRVPAGRTVLTLRPVGPDEVTAAPLRDVVVRGPERIALTGPNGAGKTTLLREVLGHTRMSRLPVVAIDRQLDPQRFASVISDDQDAARLSGISVSRTASQASSASSTWAVNSAVSTPERSWAASLD